MLYTNTPRIFKNWLFQRRDIQVTPKFTGKENSSLIALFHLQNFDKQHPQLTQCIEHHQYVIVISKVSNSLEGIKLFKMGVKGYLQSEASLSTLEKVIESIQQGNILIDNDIMKALIDGIHSPYSKKQHIIKKAWCNKLTAREKEAASAVLQGYNNKEIAEVMKISERTVKSYIRKLFDKFNVNDRVALVLKIQAEINNSNF